MPDENDIHIQYAFTNHCGGTPLMRFLQRGLKELEEEGLNPSPHIPIDVNWDAKAAVAFISPDLIVGVLQYGYSDWSRTVHTIWGYTLPEFRQKGINTALAKMVEEEAIRRGYVRMLRNTHMRNEAAQLAFEKQGYVANTIEFQKILIPATQLDSLWKLEKDK